MTTGVLQVSLLVPPLLNIFVSDVDNGIEYIISNFANNTKLRGGIAILKGKDTVHKALDRLKRWASATMNEAVQHNEAAQQVQVSKPGSGNKHVYRLGNEWIDSSPAEKGWGILLD